MNCKVLNLPSNCDSALIHPFGLTDEPLISSLKIITGTSGDPVLMSPCSDCKDPSSSPSLGN